MAKQSDLKNQMTSTHNYYMKRCIEIAKNGLGSTAPNPMVGCVITLNDSIIAEGYTSPYGGAHAEVNAINTLDDKSILQQCTLYVTLEPCAHHGKTPPCCDLIIRYKIPKVVIGCKDPNKKVNGKGIEKLQAAGVMVITNILNKECKKHHKRFLTYFSKKRPYVILKWAETKNGFIAPVHKKTNTPFWITSTKSRQLVHKWRSEEQAILVGGQTVVSDNPELSCRSYNGKNPIRVVVDKNGGLNPKYKIFNTKAPTILLDANKINFKLPIAKQICDELYFKKINSVIIEGGRKTLQAFINENLWDESRVFVGQSKLEKGVKKPTFNHKISEVKIIDKDILQYYYND